MNRRSFLKLAAATPFAAMAVNAGSSESLAACLVPGQRLSSTSTPILRVGYTAYGSRTADQLDQLTGRKAEVVRVYHKQGAPVPTTAAGAKILSQLQANRFVVLSLKVPDTSHATYNACDSLAADIKAKGYAASVWIVIWHEPFPEFTASQYIARYTPLAPAIRRHGVACGVCFHTYPIWHKGLDYTTYWPGDSITDFMCIDTYPDDDKNNQGLHADPLATISPLTSFAKKHGKPFGIAEFAVYKTDAANDPAGARAWIESFQNLGHSCRLLSYFDDFGYGLEENNALLVPDYRADYDHFNPP